MIEYKKGDLLGKNKHEFLEETKQKKVLRGANSKYLITLRFARFRCGLCNKEFENIIAKIKNDEILSCGCLIAANRKKYYENKKSKQQPMKP